MLKNNLVVLATLLCVGSGLHLPSDFQTCKRSGDDTNECLRAAIQDALPKLEKGLPNFGFPSIKPLNIPSMIVGEGKGAVHVVQNYKDVNIYGISEAKVEKVEATLAPTSLDLKAFVFIPELKLKANYDFNGRVLVLPIVGVGDCEIDLSELKAELVLRGETFEKKGKNYIDVKELTLKLRPGKVSFDFKNLFNGDERLGTEMNKVLNENWHEVFEDIKFGYEEGLAVVIKDCANKIFTKDPYEELFPL